MTTIGIIGAGHIGSQLARAATQNGYDVVISNSRGPETLSELVEELGPKATAATAAGAAAAGDFVIVTVPLGAIPSIPVEPLVGKIVIDTNNYYFERDGHIADLDNGTTTVSSMLQDHLPQSKVVKAFNHIHFDKILSTATPAGTPDRRALGTASNFPEAIELLTTFQDAIGFATVSAGDLSESWRLDRDQPAYGPHQTVEQLTANIAAATPVGK